MSETVTQQQTASAEASASEQSAATQTDVLEQLLKPEVQASLTELVESLPKLTEMVKLMTKAYDFSMLVATDKVLIDDMAGGVKEFAKPVIETVKGYASAAMEASERAAHDQSTIGVFGIMRMLKDPQMQKMLHCAQEFLNVLSERSNKKH